VIVVVIDSPHAHGYSARRYPVGLQRIAEATLRHLGVGPTLNAPAPVIVARHDAPADDIATRAVNASLASSHAPAHARPDAGSCRPERPRRRPDAHAGRADTRLEGDGFVIDQSPRAGAELSRGDGCVLKLGRRPPAAAGGTGQ
jgi:hypothetical protein